MHGRGVFATRRFAAGEIVEECPVLVFAEEDWELLEQTSLRGYYFEWAGGGVGLALGLGSLYNHSSSPNARAELDHDGALVHYRSLRTIEPGEEITIDYTGGESVELWFQPS